MAIHVLRYRRDRLEPDAQRFRFPSAIALVRERLREGVSMADLLDAVDGAMFAPPGAHPGHDYAPRQIFSARCRVLECAACVPRGVARRRAGGKDAFLMAPGRCP
jgi:hypothetical protein